MGGLKVLPAQIANMIAAGEVVQRPSSVVKELLENAVDAGADQITVVVTDAGRTLIQVIDNGCGMSPSDAVLCFERHATSKIASAEDLEQIVTYGFRGEALASIAAVAEITLRTRRAADETATEVRISGDSKVRTASVAAPAGSSFAVRNLFFNTPARRKLITTYSITGLSIILTSGLGIPSVSGLSLLPFPPAIIIACISFSFVNILWKYQEIMRFFCRKRLFSSTIRFFSKSLKNTQYFGCLKVSLVI